MQPVVVELQQPPAAAVAAGVELLPQLLLLLPVAVALAVVERRSPEFAAPPAEYL